MIVISTYERTAEFLFAAFGASHGLRSQLSQHVPRSDQMVVEDLARHSQEVGEERITKRVADADPLLSGAHDVVRPQHAELMRDNGLAQTERLLQLLHTLLTGDKELEDADPGGVGQSLKERGLERLEIADRGRGHG